LTISKADIEEFLHLTRRSLVATGRALYPDLLSLPPSKLHHELSSVLVDGERSMIIAYPREFGKSSFAWELLSSWNVLHGRYQFVMYIAETIEKAEKNLSINVVETIKAHPLLMMNIEILKQTKSNFFYRNKTTGKKFYVTAHGAGQNLRGMRMQTNRPDFVIIDDIEDTERVQSPVQRQKLKTWFWADVNPLGKDARFFFVGTMLHEDCLLANLMEEPPMDHKLGTPWETRRYGVIDDLGNSVWPEKYSDDWIDAKRREFIRAGELHRFNTEYLNVPVAKSDRAFTPDQLTFYAPDQLKAARSGGMDIIITVDPGIHNDAHRDPTVILTSGLDKNGNLWIIDLIRERFVHHEILEAIVKAYRAANPRMTYIESVAAQFWLFQDLRNGTHIGRDIIPCEKIDGSQIRMGKNVRIQGLEPLFYRRKIYVPADAKWIDQFINEMVTFPRGKTDDMLDSLSLAVLNHIKIGGLNMNFDHILASSAKGSTIF
jgi:predicted phage terminase large subunit-like protein